MNLNVVADPRYQLEARGIRKRFGATEVLKGVDLLVQPGHLVFLIGPSGSGKSTLLRCCNRLEQPDAGSIVMDKIDLLSPRTDINAARRQIGMVFQSFNLYPHLTALNNITLALRKVAGMSKREANARAMMMLDLVGLPDKASAYPTQLSGGTAATDRDRSRAGARSQDHSDGRADLGAGSRAGWQCARRREGSPRPRHHHGDRQP